MLIVNLLTIKDVASGSETPLFKLVPLVRKRNNQPESIDPKASGPKNYDSDSDGSCNEAPSRGCILESQESIMERAGEDRLGSRTRNFDLRRASSGLLDTKTVSSRPASMSGLDDGTRSSESSQSLRIRPTSMGTQASRSRGESPMRIRRNDTMINSRSYSDSLDTLANDGSINSSLAILRLEEKAKLQKGWGSNVSTKSNSGSSNSLRLKGGNSRNSISPMHSKGNR